MVTSEQCLSVFLFSGVCHVSPSIISLRELFVCVGRYGGVYVHFTVGQTEALTGVLVRAPILVCTYACMQCTPHRQTGTDLVSGIRMCLMHVSKTCTYAISSPYIRSAVTCPICRVCMAVTASMGSMSSHTNLMKVVQASCRAHVEATNQPT